MKPIQSLYELWTKVIKDPKPEYEKLTVSAAQNMGYHGSQVGGAFNFLNEIADQTSDELSVIEEVNFCIDLI